MSNLGNAAVNYAAYRGRLAAQAAGQMVVDQIAERARNMARAAAHDAAYYAREKVKNAGSKIISRMKEGLINRKRGRDQPNRLFGFIPGAPGRGTPEKRLRLAPRLIRRRGKGSVYQSKSRTQRLEARSSKKTEKKKKKKMVKKRYSYRYY